ncbi:hypothetical protein ACJJTC_019558 [Scirpophaga incertulas]
MVIYIQQPPAPPVNTVTEESEPSGPHTLMAAANGPEGPARRKRRGGKGKGKRKTEAVTDAAETAPTTASTKTPAPAEIRSRFMYLSRSCEPAHRSAHLIEPTLIESFLWTVRARVIGSASYARGS